MKKIKGEFDIDVAVSTFDLKVMKLALRQMTLFAEREMMFFYEFESLIKQNIIEQRKHMNMSQ